MTCALRYMYMYTVALEFYASQEWVSNGNGGRGIRKLER